jgi:hypothetical protein
VFTDEHEGVLVGVMARLADGDGAALVELIDCARSPMAAAVRSVAAARRARLSADEVDELVVEVALVLAEHAGGWSPEGGAPPWVWARHQVARVVDAHLGQFADPLEDAERTLGAVASEISAESEVEVLVARLAGRHPDIALLEEAVRRVATDRDRTLFWETVLQQAMGDPSPATTVGRSLGVTPAVVRQQHRRIRVRIARLAEAEPRYASVGRLPLVA